VLAIPARRPVVDSKSKLSSALGWCSDRPTSAAHGMPVPVGMQAPPACHTPTMLRIMQE